MIRKLSAAAAVALALCLASNAQAQATCGATHATTATCSPSGTQVTTTVQKIVRLTATPTSASLTAPDHTNFISSGTAQIENLALQALVVRANVNWSITIQGAAWTAPYAKPIGDLEWTKNGGTNWTALTNSAVSLETGSATNGQTVTLGYRTQWTLANDQPGVYTMPLTLTVSST